MACVGVQMGHAQITMPASGSVSTTVTGTPTTFYEPGGVGNYSNSTTSIQTLCPAINTEKIRVIFTAFATQTTSDYVEVYMGSAATGTPVATFSGTTVPANGIASTAANGCLTFKFVSDASTVAAGFTATVQSMNFACGSGNPTPADACASAPLLTNLSGFCGTTLSSYTVDGVFSGCANAFSIENSSWLKFTAATTTVVIDYAITGGTSCGGVNGSQNSNGIQLAVVTGSCGGTQTSIVCAPNPTGGIGASGTWNMTGLTAGTTYLIFIDGYAGNVCNYSFAAQSGIVACVIATVTTTPSGCSAGLYGVTGTATYSAPPASGNLFIKVDGVLKQTIAMPGGGWGTSTNYSVAGLTADGASHIVTAEFSANAGCNESQNYAAPAACITCSASSGMGLNLTTP